MALCEVCLKNEGQYCSICQAYVCQGCKWRLLARSKSALNKRFGLR